MREQLPYRPNVAIIAFRNEEFLVINRFCDAQGAWKFPQGGIDNGEDVVSAAVREFSEELGSSALEVLGVSKHTNKYEWPDAQIEREYKKQGVRWRGQKQRFVVARFSGEENELEVEEEEVRAYKWVSRADVLRFDGDAEHALFKHYNHTIASVLDEFNL